MKRQWWKEAVVYQIYPRSFNDSNGDGIGDLNGITEKLDYLAELGVDVVWLSPCYQSPNDDNGYDISDYRAIMKEFGTLEDWQRMIQEMHKRGIKLLMDLVVNHTSDEHQWFIESRKDKNNPYRDYYIWRSGEKGEEPNDWVSYFSGSTWEYDEDTEEYYLHLFSRKQPDLNWENEKVRQEVYDMMIWWLEQGVDGFRMDVINMISKVPELPSVSQEKGYKFGGQYFLNGPKVHDYLREMNEVVLSKYDTLTVGETPGVTVEDAKLYSGEDRHELNMVFQFELMGVDHQKGNKWDYKEWCLTDFKAIIRKWQLGLADEGWNSLYLNNHDQPRQVSRFGNDKEYRVESAKMLATMLHTLKGTPYIYQGEEIGMTNVAFKNINEYQDIESINMYNEASKQGTSEEELLAKIHQRGRDNARTPMQWDDSEHAGFTTGQPWIKVNPNYEQINAMKSVGDKNSIFNYYKQLIQLRKKYPVFVYGEFMELLEESEELFVYTRTFNDQDLLVILNFCEKSIDFCVDDKYLDHKLLISNYERNKLSIQSKLSLRPYEATVYYKSNN
ncbi:alpha-glucosidase [Vallitalea okinawensis]|uniref:alpha-glucosidase n=1 Tax=Vallitalea okinawensis TaxID=2078660 RepID=UPI000CFADD43|nr:alpha-glucosidase [Vallitalea okinawensis]